MYSQSSYTKDNCSRSCYFKMFRAKPIGEYINLIRHTRGEWSMHSLFLSSAVYRSFLLTAADRFIRIDRRRGAAVCLRPKFPYGITTTTALNT